MRLSEVGSLLRIYGLRMELNYGSGGYSVVLRDWQGCEGYGCKWDIEEAFEDAFEKIKKRDMDEKTNPGIVRKK